ncbi:hypothetical protein [Paenibacillus alvei]|nr:hypothetical protein [Paenibacillus alvei]
MVTGNLRAKNIAVGGQEIYVSGNLMIEEILCGSYNHGETIVQGDLTVKRVQTKMETTRMPGLKSELLMERIIFIHWIMEIMFHGIISHLINMACRTCPYWI